MEEEETRNNDNDEKREEKEREGRKKRRKEGKKEGGNEGRKEGRKEEWAVRLIIILKEIRIKIITGFYTIEPLNGDQDPPASLLLSSFGPIGVLFMPCCGGLGNALCRSPLSLPHSLPLSLSHAHSLALSLSLTLFISPRVPSCTPP